MIVAETETGFQLTTQPAHAALTGQLAQHWGNDRFEAPAPEAAMVIAATAHDDGWLRFDRRPRLGDDAPLDFKEMSAGVWIDLYDEGIEAVVDIDPYAGLLVSMHGSGLQRGWYGHFAPALPARPTPAPAYAPFVDREETRQTELLEKLREGNGVYSEWISAADERILATIHEEGTGPETAGAASRLWHNYALLQVWDHLSLAFCTAVPPPSRDSIPQVPTVAGEPTETLRITALGGEVFRIRPYPFDRSPLSLQVPTRIVPQTAIDGDDEGKLVRAYYAADREHREFTLRS
jgi:hypothetical protein